MTDTAPTYGPPPLKLTALIYPAESNPTVYIGRLKELGGIVTQEDSVAEALADLQQIAGYMLPKYKQEQAQALYAQQQPGTNWPGTFTITHDVEASAAEAALVLYALPNPPPPEMMLPAALVAAELRGLLVGPGVIGEYRTTVNELIHQAATRLGLDLTTP